MPGLERLSELTRLPSFTSKVIHVLLSYSRAIPPQARTSQLLASLLKSTPYKAVGASHPRKSEVCSPAVPEKVYVARLRSLTAERTFLRPSHPITAITMPEKTALVLVDVYNDFLHPHGKATGAMAESLEKFRTIEHLVKVLKTAREADLPVYYSLHQQYHDGKYSGFEHWNDMLRSIESSHSFEEHSWGAEIFKDLTPDLKRGETIISKHWNQRYRL